MTAMPDLIDQLTGPTLPRDDPAPPVFHRYVAVGDSFTEGVGDPDPARPNGVRGWAEATNVESQSSLIGVGRVAGDSVCEARVARVDVQQVAE